MSTTYHLFSPLSDVDAEERACREACGLLDRGGVDRLEMLGADRERFLQGRVTCDVKDLPVGGGIYGFIPQIKGRILADVVVLALEDRLLLELPAGRGELITDHLSKYILADRVEIRPSPLRPLTLLGPRAAEHLGPPGELPATPWSHRPARVRGIDVHLVRHPEPGTPMWTLWTADDEAAALAAKLAAEGAVPVGGEARDRLRVSAGWAVYGKDFGEENFPQEIEPLPEGFGEAVSYTKGCYLGQEVIARIHYRGGVNRRLRGLRIDAQRDVVGAAVLSEGRAAGTVTSATRGNSSGGGDYLGLAVLQTRVEPGARAELEGGGEVEVVELPFAG